MLVVCSAFLFGCPFFVFVTCAIELHEGMGIVTLAQRSQLPLPQFVQGNVALVGPTEVAKWSSQVVVNHVQLFQSDSSGTCWRAKTQTPIGDIIIMHTCQAHLEAHVV